MARELRHPAGADEFNRLELIPLKKRLAAPWWNLRWAEHEQPVLRLPAAASGRLTPHSGRVPCLYLAQNRETSFCELYGDLVDSAQKSGVPPKFTKKTLADRVFLKTTETITMNLYDLTASKSAKKIGMDLATLYTPAVTFPREFAQRLHDHPAGFDGIQYVSRHTQSICLVLWATHAPGLRTLPMQRTQSLWDLAKYEKGLPPGTLKLFDTLIDVAAAPEARASR